MLAKAYCQSLDIINRAYLISRQTIGGKESRGLHYSIDYPLNPKSEEGMQKKIFQINGKNNHVSGIQALAGVAVIIARRQLVEMIEVVCRVNR